jgi:hypothetical protein
MSSSHQTPNITLYTSQTPNGIKISITLAELGLPYKVHKIDMSSNEQKSPWFTAINPNGRIPALTDTHSDGDEIHIFESGSIMQYLVDTYDPEHKISYPRGSREAIEMTVCWHSDFIHAGSKTNNFNRTGSSCKTQAWAPTKVKQTIMCVTPAKTSPTPKQDHKTKSAACTPFSKPTSPPKDRRTWSGRSAQSQISVCGAG